MSAALAFWAAALLVAALALPVSFRLFRRLPDAGAGLSFALGMTMVGWAYFVLRTVRVLPQGRGGAILMIALLALLAAAVAGRDRRFRKTLRRSFPATLTIGGVFTVFFFAFVAFRSYTPDIAGTEQPMDLMYLNAAVTSPDYPPHDPWLAGERASYYYFGYVQAGILTQVAGVPTSTGYNLSLAYIFAACAAGVASLTFALARWALPRKAREWAFAAGAAGIVLLLLLGSLAGVLEFAAAHGWGSAGLYEAAGVEWMKPCTDGQAEDCRPESPTWYPTRFFFWFDDTRVIRSTPDTRDTITEFPVFSFILGDLHPHVMSIPLVILVLGLTAAAWRGRGRLEMDIHRRQPFEGLLLGVLLGALAFQNAWDLLTFAGLFAVAVAVRNLRRDRLRVAALNTVGYLVPIAGVAVVAYLPWYFDFSSQAEGLYPYVGAGSRPSQAFLQFGPLVLAGLVSLTWAARRQQTREIADVALLTAWVPLLPIILWMALARYHGELSDAVTNRGAGGWITLTAYGVATWALATAFALLARARHPGALPVGLAALGTLLLFGSELLLIKDIFYGSSPRLNTVFKLSYQAWILLSAAGAVALTLAAHRAARGRSAIAWLWAPAAALVALGLVYVLIAVPNRTNGLSGETSVDGLAFLAQRDPAEYALTRWMQEHVAPDEVILEATGRQYSRGQGGTPVIVNASVDYTDASRISARTGLATPIGWYFHEIQWRGDTKSVPEELAGRQELVDRAYLSTDPADVLQVLRQTGATYLVVGAVETQKYAGLMPPFENFLDVAFESGAYRVYRLPTYRVISTS